MENFPTYIHAAMFVFMALLLTNLAIMNVESFKAKQVVCGLGVPIFAVFGAYFYYQMASKPLGVMEKSISNLVTQHTELVRELNTPKSTNSAAGRRGSGPQRRFSAGAPVGMPPRATNMSNKEEAQRIQESLLREMESASYEQDIYETTVYLKSLARKFALAQQARMADRQFSHQSAQAMSVSRPSGVPPRSPARETLVAPQFPDHTPYGDDERPPSARPAPVAFDPEGNGVPEESPLGTTAKVSNYGATFSLSNLPSPTNEPFAADSEEMHSCKSGDEEEAY